MIFYLLHSDSYHIIFEKKFKLYGPTKRTAKMPRRSARQENRQWAHRRGPKGQHETALLPATSRNVGSRARVSGASTMN